jgi:hypothetical protein
MKTTLLSLFAVFFLAQSYGQSFEVSLLANGGLFHYSGNYPVSYSFFNDPEAGKTQGYTNNPYGKSNAFSYGFGGQAELISKGGFIIGLQAAFEVLRSKVNIDTLYGNEVTPFYNYGPEADNIYVHGQTILQSQFINLNPFIGYRFNIKNVRLDLTPGVDIAFNVNTHEYGRATGAGNNVYQTNYNYGKGKTDLRARFGAAAWYKKFGLTASYSRGLTNYSSHLLNDSPTAYTTNSEVMRFGLAYRIL